jgi:HTH-type transcriptional regulator / antitoxin HigA
VEEEMDIKPIRSDADHRAAVDEIRALWDAAPDSPEEDRLDILATLVDEYERKRWPIDKLDPVEAIEAAMQSEGHTRADLAALVGQNRATEILSRKRALTLPMIRAISAAWHVPTEVLVREYQLAN